MTHPSDLHIQPEVAAALAAGRPVVALESTIISHGMPWPRNVETALAVEAEVRAHGAVPATCALLDGRLQVGLATGEIERLGRNRAEVAKVSRRDIPIVVARRGTGATTVAATMIVASLAGIRVFATGGIGGVHRGAPASLDISADLQELARTSVAVVCAGVKAILDIGLTLEYLETHGVPVLGCGQEAFAAFYVRDSGYRADFRLDDAQAQARFIRTQWTLGLSTGVVVAAPVPADHALAREEVDGWIGAALQEAQDQGIAGKAVTPFLLARVAQLSDGRSLAANIALVKHNAQVGARLALALAALREVTPGG